MKTKSGQITVEADFSQLSKKKLFDELPKHLIKYLYEKYVDIVKIRLSNVLVPENFIGDAKNHIFKLGLEQTDELIEKYSLAIYIDFLSDASNLIKYNEDTNKIELSELFWALEHGDFYKPALHIFSNEIKDLAKAAEEAMAETVKK